MQMFEVREKEPRFGPATITYHRTYEEAAARVARSTMGTRERQDIPGHEYLEIVTIERDSLPCMTCGGERENTGDKYPYCRSCHYSGRAGDHIRADQLAYFKHMIPEAQFIGTEHTGGGCMWMAFRFEGRREYVVATDGDASLPAVFDEETQEWTPCRDGWGAMMVTLECLDECSAGDDGFECCSDYYADLLAGFERVEENDGFPLVTDREVALLIRGWLDGTVTPEPPYRSPAPAAA